jgi:hypothetical protein
MSGKTICYDVRCAHKELEIASAGYQRRVLEQLEMVGTGNLKFFEMFSGIVERKDIMKLQLVKMRYGLSSLFSRWMLFTKCDK